MLESLLIGSAALLAARQLLRSHDAVAPPVTSPPAPSSARAERTRPVTRAPAAPAPRREPQAGCRRRRMRRRRVRCRPRPAVVRHHVRYRRTASAGGAAAAAGARGERRRGASVGDAAGRAVRPADDRRVPEDRWARGRRDLRPADGRCDRASHREANPAPCLWAVFGGAVVGAAGGGSRREETRFPPVEDEGPEVRPPAGRRVPAPRWAQAGRHLWSQNCGRARVLRSRAHPATKRLREVRAVERFVMFDDRSLIFVGFDPKRRAYISTIVFGGRPPDSTRCASRFRSNRS